MRPLWLNTAADVPGLLGLHRANAPGSLMQM